jgi:hypothetical protein
VAFITPWKQILGWYLKLGYYHFLQHPFQFFIHSQATVLRGSLSYYQRHEVNQETTFSSRKKNE